MQSTTTGGLFRRPLSLTLTAAFSALALTACGGGSSAPASSSPAGATEQGTATALSLIHILTLPTNREV